MKPWILIPFVLSGFTGWSHASASNDSKPVVTVGSKSFTESYILAEIVSEIIEGAGEAVVNRRFGMGATGILYNAVRTGSIDIYPEYSGTISEVILKDSSAKTLGQIRSRLLPLGLTVSNSLGFSNNYALGLRHEVAASADIRKISDLAKDPGLRFGFSYEFINRPDGYSALIRAYRLDPKNVRSMEHSIAYEALAQNQIDCTDVYSTDAKIVKLNLTLLADDKNFFPKYVATLFMRRDFAKIFPKLGRPSAKSSKMALIKSESGNSMPKSNWRKRAFEK